MSKSNVAFLCFSALPYTSNWGGSQRVHYMANALSEDYEVTVIAPKYNNNAPFGNINRKYTTKYFNNPLGRKLFSARSKSSDININKTKKGFKLKVKEKVFQTLISIIKNINSTFYNEPTFFKGIESDFWTRTNTNKIIQTLKYNKIELLIISIPPWNIITMSFLKKVRRLGIRIVVDYRDPWNCWNDKTGYPFKKEKKILDLADMVFVTNDNHRLKLLHDFSLKEDLVKVVMNGYDNDAWEDIEKIGTDDSPTDKLVISYIGSIQFKESASFRNPMNFLKALQSFKYKDEIIFRVVGSNDKAAIQKYSEIIPNFEMIGSVSQAESFIWMLKSDVLVNFHTTNDNSSKYLISGKAFDYYRSGAQILSINGKDSYEHKFIINNNAGYISSNDLKEMCDVLEKIHSDWINNDKSLPKRASCNNIYSRQYQNLKAKTYISQLLNNK